MITVTSVVRKRWMALKTSIPAKFVGDMLYNLKCISMEDLEEIYHPRFTKSEAAFKLLSKIMRGSLEVCFTFGVILKRCRNPVLGRIGNEIIEELQYAGLGKTLSFSSPRSSCCGTVYRLGNAWLFNSRYKRYCYRGYLGVV